MERIYSKNSIVLVLFSLLYDLFTCTNTLDRRIDAFLLSTPAFIFTILEYLSIEIFIKEIAENNDILKLFNSTIQVFDDFN